mgnify:FL=1
MAHSVSFNRNAVLLYCLATAVVFGIHAWSAAVSEAHRVAVEDIKSSRELQAVLGDPGWVIPFGFREKHTGFSVSCSERTYLVIGSRDFAFVTVWLRLKNYYRGSWEPYDLLTGFAATSQESCSPILKQ